MYWNSLSPEQQHSLRLRQGSLEIGQVDRGIASFTANIEASGPMNMLTKDIIREGWFTLVQDMLVQKYNITCRKQGPRPPWHHTVMDIPSQRLALIALTTIFDTVRTSHIGKDRDPSWVLASREMMEALDHDATCRAIEAANVARYGSSIDVTQFTPRQMKQIAIKAGASIGIGLSSKDRARMGAFLVGRVVESTGLFIQHRRPVPGKSPLTTVRMSEKLREFLGKRLKDTAYMFPKHQPMIMPPLNWGEGNHHGGYITLTCPLIKGSKVRSIGTPDPTTLEAVNFIQATPFRISKVASCTADVIWNNAREGAGLPCSEPTPLPPLVEEFESEEHRDEVMEHRRLIHDRNNQEIGKRIAAMSTLTEARNNREHGAIWFPHNVDFRSRIYSAPSPVQPQGSDYSKGMLEFADALPLGERGLYWLKVQLANSFGIDKVSFDDRVKAAEDIITPLLGQEFNPLNWSAWEDADKPFAALTAATELHAALSMPNPYAFKSRQPIAMDGSCNGLQHLSAMGRDTIAGAAVNLLDSDVPGDIYSLVKDHVISVVEVEQYMDIMAAAWHGNVTRKTVKRGVMTTPYGVTFKGIRDQLVTDGFTQGLNGNEFKLANYMAKKITEGIGEVFAPGKAIMTWLQESASLMAKQGFYPEWECPLGFTAIQHYVKPKKEQVRVTLPSGPIQMTLRSWDQDKLDAKKTRNGIAPNFVHSLDAAHEMATVLALKDQGVEHFLGVHDSYSVHACHVDTMQTIIRDSFVQVHESDPLGTFKRSNEERTGITLPDLPEVGSLQLGDVRNSTYLFS